MISNFISFVLFVSAFFLDSNKKMLCGFIASALFAIAGAINNLKDQDNKNKDD
ncbi:MAG: hypothetical protein IJX78_00710 [Bacilli bacterium]|nr:hypothetical protein [Bacilli bacterium]